MSEKNLIIYYSWSGNTGKIAKLIGQKAGGDLWEIEPQEEYPVQYGTVVAQAKKEIQAGVRPELISIPSSVGHYENIFIGSPNWWNTMAPPVLSFCSAFDFSGKRIFPFCTHGGGGEGRVLRDITKNCRQASSVQGVSFYNDGGRDADREITTWLSLHELL